MLTIEKVLILKSVGIFSEVSEEHLTEVAGILEEVECLAGEQIIKKGEIGTSLYIIVHGKVHVHDGPREIAMLGERDVVGDLAVLDPGPRAADVTAIEDAILFRVEGTALYSLMEIYVSLNRAIIQMLCRRLRSAIGAPGSQGNAPAAPEPARSR